MTKTADLYEEQLSELYKSPLPLTDPRDTVPDAHHDVYTCRRSV